MSDEDGTCCLTVTICNQRGLHARAAAKFAETAGGFEAEIQVTCLDNTVSGLSIMGLMMLAASQGTEIELRATGPDAESALAALAKLVKERFGEE
jgi:phosphocarrier protein